MRASVRVLILVAALLTATPAARAAAPPVFAKSFVVRAVAGTVTVTPPGGHPGKLAGARQVPVGSSFDARKGSVNLTAADGKGATYSGTFGKGSFQAAQSVSGSGATVIKVLGQCAPAKAADPVARVARRRHHAPVYRQLQVSAQGNFLVEGKNASAVASGGSARYSLVDACDGTHIVDEAGHVQAKQKHGPTKILDPSQSQQTYCFPSAQAFAYCLLTISSPKQSAFSFGVALSNRNAQHYGVCFTSPTRQRMCFTGRLAPGSFQGAGLFCTVNDGPGIYPFHYFLDGRQIGPLLHFKVTQPAQPFRGQDNCENKQLGSS